MKSRRLIEGNQAERDSREAGRVANSPGRENLAPKPKRKRKHYSIESDPPNSGMQDQGVETAEHKELEYKGSEKKRDHFTASDRIHPLIRPYVSTKMAARRRSDAGILHLRTPLRLQISPAVVCRQEADCWRKV
ncbi:hypothetical protein GW17_00046279 [Ensete ventricosum]|nr:hypothetical protein GW17_00046279 [Ensete ventricosum]